MKRRRRAAKWGYSNWEYSYNLQFVEMISASVCGDDQRCTASFPKILGLWSQLEIEISGYEKWEYSYNLQFVEMISAHRLLSQNSWFVG